MNTYILMANIENNERVEVTGLEDAKFESPSHALQHVNKYEIDKNHINKCVPLTDFLDMVNNEEFADQYYWITSVLIENPQ